MVCVRPMAAFSTTFWPRWRSSSVVSTGKPRSTRSSSGVHWWWKRGADAASAGFMPWSMALLTVCSTVVMMRAPPGLPVTSQGLPSFSTKVGVMDDSGRLRGPTALASPPTRP